MNILGVNAGRAVPPRLDEANSRRLADGSAALVSSGEVVCATIEERHSHKRYDGGFGHSVPAALRSARISLEDVDAVGMSTCCDSRWTEPSDIVDCLVEELGGALAPSLLRGNPQSRVHCIDHHDSHAMLAFVGSGFRRSLVCVLDGFGNRRDDTDRFHAGPDWWNGSFDRQTFYVGEWRGGRVRLDRVLEASTGSHEIGLAELYRAVTHYLGWPSYQYAGKTMALAGYGDPNALAELCLIDSDLPCVKVANQHHDPIGQIETAILAAGYQLPKDVRRPATPDEPFLANVAARLQLQLENALRHIVETLAERHGVCDVAFGGGVAMNCVALGKLAMARPDLNFYVPPAPSDTGQGLGNALWLAHSDRSPISVAGDGSAINTAALGPSYDAQTVRAALGSLGASAFHAQSFDDDATLADATANLVADGMIVALRTGRAEYGPRALGSCSILADPRLGDVKDRVNRVKKREWFRPFATSVLEREAHAYFEGDVKSPFMSFAMPATSLTREVAPGIVHIDGTTRIQTVRAGESTFASVLEKFYSRTGLPMMLNTSFNLAGDPMVETPADAVDVFRQSEIDVLVLGRHIVTRR